MSSSDTLPAEKEIQDTNDARYTTIVAITIILYDNLLTLPVEVAYLWPKPWRHSIKSIYLVNKYFSIAIMFVTGYPPKPAPGPNDNFVIIITYLFLLDLTLVSCRAYTIFAPLAQLISDILSKWILTLRLVALYAQNKHIVRSLYIVYGVSYLVCAALTFLSTKYDIDAVVISPNAGECFVNSAPTAFAFIFIAPLVYEVYMAALTLWKAFLHAKVLNDRTSAPVLHVMFRDGIMYFVMVVLARVILIWLVLARGSVYLGITLQWSIDVTLVSRFYLNLLEVASPRTNVSIWNKRGPVGVTNVSTELGEFAVNTTTQRSTTVGGSAGLSSHAYASTQTMASSSGSNKRVVDVCLSPSSHV